MITNLLKSVSSFSLRYKPSNVAILNACKTLPEFQEVIENLKKVNAEHVGLKQNDLKTYFKKGRITYFKVHETNDFSVGVFCLSRGCSLELHDHPNMLVISKILTGTIHCRALDLVDQSFQVSLPDALFHKNDPRVIGKKLDAIVRQDRELKTEEIVWLTPDAGNIHSFTALEDSAIFDILAPNYDHDSRFCNFYKENGQNQDKKDQSKIIKMIDTIKAGNAEKKEQKDLLKNPGENTSVKYILPPLDMNIDIVPYKGEPFKLD